MCRHQNCEKFSTYHYQKTARKESGRKFSGELLVHLYLEFVQRECPIDHCGLLLLDGLEGSHEKLLKGKPNQMTDCICWSQKKRGLPDTKAQDYKSVEDIIPYDYKFSTFVQGVLNDVIDTDNFPSLQEHCKESDWYSSYLSMRKDCEVKAGYALSDREMDLLVSKHHQEEANYLYAQTRNFLKTETIAPEKRAKLFQYMCEKGVIKNVTVHPEEWKPLLLDACMKREDNTKPYQCESDDPNGVSLDALIKMLPQSFAEHKAAKEKEQKLQKEKAKKGELPVEVPIIISVDSHDSEEQPPLQYREPQSSTSKRSYEDLVDNEVSFAAPYATKTVDSLKKRLANEYSLNLNWEKQAAEDMKKKRQKKSTPNLSERRIEALQNDRKKMIEKYEKETKANQATVDKLNKEIADAEAEAESSSDQTLKRKVATLKGKLTKLNNRMQNASETHATKLQRYTAELEDLQKEKENSASTDSDKGT